MNRYIVRHIVRGAKLTIRHCHLTTGTMWMPDVIVEDRKSGSTAQPPSSPVIAGHVVCVVRSAYLRTSPTDEGSDVTRPPTSCFQLILLLRIVDHGVWSGKCCFISSQNPGVPDRVFAFAKRVPRG